MKPPPLFNITKQSCIVLLEHIYYWFLNCQSLICPLLSTNATPVLIQNHKTTCIFLPGNLFQLISKQPSIDLILVDQQWKPYPCSISQNNIYCTTWKCISILFINYLALIWPLLITTATPITVQYNKQAVLYCLEMYFNLFLNCQSLILFLLRINSTPISFQ